MLFTIPLVTLVIGTCFITALITADAEACLTIMTRASSRESCWLAVTRDLMRASQRCTATGAVWASARESS